MSRRVCIIGAGIIGLSTAVHVQEALDDVTVTIVTELVTPHTTGDGAGGMWQPFFLANTPVDKIRDWGNPTFQHLLRLSSSELAGTIGVYLVSGVDIFNNVVPKPFWADTVIGYRELSEPELRSYAGASYGYGYTTIFCEGKKYIPWLMNRFGEQGGRLIQKKINNFEEAIEACHEMMTDKRRLHNTEIDHKDEVQDNSYPQVTHGTLYSDFDVIVNCTGLGARELCADDSLIPVKGQIIKVEAPWIKHFVDFDDVDDVDVAILVNADCIILCGTHEAGVDNLRVNELARKRIWSKCCQLIPSLKKSRYISDWVGLRPSRPCVRLELETRRCANRDIKIVHNYGHGGAGITLHWGCAQEAANLVKQALADFPAAKL